MARRSNGEGLTNLVRYRYQQEMLHDARFKNTVEVALSGSTDDDVLALLVAGLAAACRDAAYLRDEMIQVIERHGVTNPQADGRQGSEG